MKSATGELIQLSLFGESHGEAIGVVIQGLPSGIEIDRQWMARCMNLRKPKGIISTQRQEEDEPEIVSGLFEGKTTGTPLCIVIKNEAQNSKDYEKTRTIPRPSHADYTAQIKYFGFQDYRGGGHFSGRITAPLVAAGAIFLQLLRDKNIVVGTHIYKLHGIQDLAFSSDEKKIRTQIEYLNKQYFPCICNGASEKMQERIQEAQQQSDSVGGLLESVVVGMPAGVGEPFFDSVESKLSHLLFSIGAVKGIEFGIGFKFADGDGSTTNDEWCYKKNEVKTRTNFNGGINGGITNGMPLIIKTVVKPTPSIYQEQDSIDWSRKKQVKLKIKGRHDPAIVHRARIVVDSMIAFGLVDLLTQRYGILWWGQEK